jgi:hypothetical protein
LLNKFSAFIGISKVTSHIFTNFENHGYAHHFGKIIPNLCYNKLFSINNTTLPNRAIGGCRKLTN